MNKGSIVNFIEQTNREQAMSWWNAMNLEEQFYKTIEHNSLITGDRTRHPHTLTGSEIETIYKASNE